MHLGDQLDVDELVCCNTIVVTPIMVFLSMLFVVVDLDDLSFKLFDGFVSLLAVYLCCVVHVVAACVVVNLVDVACFVTNSGDVFFLYALFLLLFYCCLFLHCFC